MKSTICPTLNLLSIVELCIPCQCRLKIGGLDFDDLPRVVSNVGLRQFDRGFRAPVADEGKALNRLARFLDYVSAGGEYAVYSAQRERMSERYRFLA